MEIEALGIAKASEIVKIHTLEIVFTFLDAVLIVNVKRGSMNED